jgi:hypothetical protein
VPILPASKQPTNENRTTNKHPCAFMPTSRRFYELLTASTVRELKHWATGIVLEENQPSLAFSSIGRHFVDECWQGAMCLFNSGGS